MAPLVTSALAWVGTPIAAASEPIQGVTVEQAAAGESGWATVRVVLEGADTDTITAVSVAPTDSPAAMSDIGAGRTVELRAITLDGPGRIDYPPIPAAVDVAVPTLRSCARGGYPAGPSDDAPPWSSEDTRLRYVHLPAGATTAVRVAVRVPGGFEGVEPGLVVNATALTPDRGSYGSPGWAWGAPIAVPITRSATPSDAIRFAASDRRGGRTRVSGQVFPARAGAVVEFAGRKFRTDNEIAVLVPQLSALQPVGERLHRYGATTTGPGGRFSTWVTLPDRATLAARTAGLAGRTLPGASCPVAVVVPPTTLQQAKRNAKALVAHVEGCFTDTSDYRRCRRPVANSLGTNTGLWIVQRAPLPGEVRVTAPSRDRFEVTAVDDNKVQWIITRGRSGHRERSCRLASGRKCRPSQW